MASFFFHYDCTLILTNSFSSLSKFCFCPASALNVLTIRSKSSGVSNTELHCIWVSLPFGLKNHSSNEVQYFLNLKQLGLLFNLELRIPYYFPKMPVRVLEIACITIIKGVLRRLDYFCTSRFSLDHNSIHFFLCIYIVSDGKL